MFVRSYGEGLLQDPGHPQGLQRGGDQEGLPTHGAALPSRQEQGRQRRGQVQGDRGGLRGPQRPQEESGL